MRWSKYMLSASVICALSLTACKDQQGSSAKRISGSGRTYGKMNRDRQLKKDTEPGRRSDQLEAPTDQDIKIDSSADQCYADLCAANKEVSLPKLMEEKSKGTEEQKKYFKKAIQPTMSKWMDAETTYNKQLLASIEKFEGQFAKIDLKETHQRILKALLLILDSAYSDVLNETLKGLEKEVFIKAYTSSVVSGSESYFRLLHSADTNEDLLKILKSESAYINKTVDAINKASGAVLLEVNVGTHGRLANGELLQGPELLQLVRESFLSRLFEFIILKNPELLNKVEISDADLKEIFNKGNLKARLQKRIDGSKDYLKICESKYYQSLSLLPSDEGIAKFRKIEELVRAEVLKQLSPQDKAYAKVKETKVFYPPTYTTANVSWLKVMESAKTQHESFSKNLKVLDASGVLVTALAHSIIPEGQGLCEMVYDLDISDKAHADESTIAMSWASIAYPRYGISILAHEMGHLIARASDAKETENGKQCLAEKNDKQFVEEDFADSVAAKVSKALQNSHPQGNLGCFLASGDSKKSLKAASEKSVHSSSLYRALQIADIRGDKVPSSCTTLLKSEAPKSAAKSCH